MKRLAPFGRFWYDFIVGDDWTVAVAVVVAIAVTAAARAPRSQSVAARTARRCRDLDVVGVARGARPRTEAARRLTMRVAT